MVLPVGAALMPIMATPYELLINTAQSTAMAMQNSRAVTSDDVSEGNLSAFVDPDECWKPGGTLVGLGNGDGIKMNTPPALMDAWDRAIVGGNPEGKTLQDLTLILTKLFLDPSENRRNAFLLASDYGQIILNRKFGGRVSTYVPALNNDGEFQKEKHARINDELTLSVLQVLYKESTVNNFLGVRNDYLPGLLVR